MEQDPDENPLWKTKPVYPITGELINTKHFYLQMPNDKSMEQEELSHNEKAIMIQKDVANEYAKSFAPDPEAGVIIFEQFKEKVIQTFDGQIVEKVNPLRQRLEKLKEEYAGAEVVIDPASMKKAKEATAAFRTFKGEVEDNRKLWKGMTMQLGDIVDESHNPIKDEAELWQKKMDSPAKAFEEKQRAERQTEKIALAKRKALRNDQLTQLGAFTSSGVFILGDETAMEDTVELCTDEGFNEILSRFKAEKEKIEAEAAEVERKRQEEAENVRREQEQLRIQREEMQKEIDRIQLEREKLEKDREAVAKAERDRIEAEEKKARWEKAEAERSENERIEKLWRGRLSELLDVVWNGEAAIYNDSEFITIEELIYFSDEDFNKVRDIHNKRVVDNRADAERKRQYEDEVKRKEAEIEEKRKSRLLILAGIDHFDAAIEPFIGDWSDDGWNALYSAAKQAYDARKEAEWLENERIKKIQEQEREKERLAELTDGERWREFKTALAKFAADMPDFPSGRYARMKAIALDKFGEIQAMRWEQFKGNK